MNSNIPKTKEELLFLIRTNGWFYYKDLINNFNLNHNQVKYLLRNRFDISIKDEFKQWLEKQFNNGCKPKDINKKYSNIPLQTIYHYYKKWRKEPINKVGLKKRQLIMRLRKCNYSLNCYRNRYETSPDKVKRMLKDYNLLDWFYEKQKTVGIRKLVELRKYKKGELKKNVYEFFDEYPNAINKSGEKLSVIFECSAREINRIKKQYKKDKGLI